MTDILFTDQRQFWALFTQFYRLWADDNYFGILPVLTVISVSLR